MQLQYTSNSPILPYWQARTSANLQTSTGCIFHTCIRAHVHMFNLFVFYSREGVYGSSSSSGSGSGSSSSSSIGSRKKVTVAAAAVVEAAVVAVIVAVVVLKIYSSICSRSLYGSSCCGCGCSCGRCSSSLRTAPSYPCLSSCLPSLSPSVSLLIYF